jgi:hypothetical protein
MSAGTGRRSIRVPDDLWNAAISATVARGDTVTDVIRAALVDYIRERPPAHIPVREPYEQGIER